MSRRGAAPGGRLAARAAIFLLRFYPAEFRRRFGDDVRRALQASVDSGAPAGRILADSVSTCLRAWTHGAFQRRARPAGGTWSGVGADVRLALRSVVHDPLYAVLMVSTLAIAIGANAAVVDVAWSVLVRTLPWADPERIVSVEPSPVRLTTTGFAVSRTLTEVPHVELAAAYTTGGRASLGTSGAAAEVAVTQVTRDFFDVLGVSMRLGAGPGSSAEGELVAVLSDALWRGAFGGDRSVIGRTVVLSGTGVRVGGVAPPDVAFPAGTDVWLTYPLVGSFFGAASGADVIARVRRADLIGEARDAHLERVRSEWSSRGDALPEPYEDLAFVPLRWTLVGPVRAALLILLSAASLVLLLGCINLAGVTLARRSARIGDLAVRRALGASRLGLLRMMMTESLVPALAAGALSIAVLVGGRGLLGRLLPDGLPGLGDGAPSLPAIGFIAGATVVAGLLIGLIPALHALSRTGGIGVAGRLTEGRRRLHPSLVVTEIALAVVLVIGAGLLGRSLAALRSVPLGYDIEHVLTFEVRLPTGYEDPDAWRGYGEALRERLAALPGVAAAGIASRLPVGEGIGSAYRLWPASRAEPDSSASGSVVWATMPFFDAMGIPLLAGGGFVAGDRYSIVVSRSLALTLFGRVDVVGEQIRVRSSVQIEPDLFTIAGVTGDMRMTGYEADVARVIYLPWRERPVRWLALAVRSTGEPGALAGEVRAAVAAVDPSVAPLRLTTTRAAARGTIATREALSFVATLFGGAALLLAALGTYGLLAQSVARRRREVGIRMAVGAAAPHVIRMVVGEAGRLAALGACIGMAAAFATTRWLTAFLWNVQTYDPITFLAVPLLVLLVAIAAAALPARRAVRIDPARTLRAD